MEEAVSIALRDNRDVLLKEEDVKKAKLKLKESRAELLPDLNFTVSRTQTRQYYPKNLDSTTTQTTLKQTIYDGGENINTIRYSEYGLKATEALLDQTRLESVLNVKKAFYSLLLAIEFTDLNKAILDNTQFHLDSLRQRYQNGHTSKQDILKMEESLNNVKEVYQASSNQIESAQDLLKNLLYLDGKMKITPEAKFAYEPIELAYEEAFLKAMENRPEIKQYQANEKAAEKNIQIAKAGNRPTVYASWDYYSKSTTSLTFAPTKAWQDYSLVGITFAWPIFDGLATKAKVEQAIVDLKETQLLKDKLTKDIALELKNSYLSLKNAIAKLKTAESEVVFYKDNISVVEQRFRGGIASSLELDDAKLSYNVARFNQKQAIYDYIIAKFDFDKATGGI